MDELYWNSIDFGSEESLHSPRTKPYVDPWDLENYAYIRSHLDSEFSSDPGGSSGEFAEANSTSFYYVPGNTKPHLPSKTSQRRESLITDNANYVAIDDLHTYEENLKMIPEISYRRKFNSGSNDVSSDDYIQHKIHNRRREIIPTTNTKDRSLSFSYGDLGYDPYASKNQIYDEKSSALSDYEDLRKFGNKPKNFGLSNYGHLQIDYSYSWNNLNNYIYK